MSHNFQGKTLILSGGSRGIGLEIALQLARSGANITLIAKTAEPHPQLEGTVHTAAEAIKQAGGDVLPIVGDIRDDETVHSAVEQTVEKFGGIDYCLNNASALSLGNVETLKPKQYDLMQDINVRGTYMLSSACIPHLLKAKNPHILTLSPPIDLNPRWPGEYLGYTIAKYGMSLCTMGFAEEFRSRGVAANSLWPRTTIATAAVKNLLGGEAAIAKSRTPAIIADAACAILARPASECTGNFFTDEEVLTQEGVTDFRKYRADGGASDGPLAADLFFADDVYE